MVDLSVALTWIAISAASVKGLSAFARAAASAVAETPQASTGEYDVRAQMGAAEGAGASYL